MHIPLISSPDPSILVGVIDTDIMKLAITEAKQAAIESEVPVGAVIVSPDRGILSRAHNLTRSACNPTAHAEILAIVEASARLGNYRLPGCTLYVTKEPCIMCAGAIAESRIERLVFGCYDVKRGAFSSAFDVNQLPLNHKVHVQGGVLEKECAAILRSFFMLRRGTEAVITGPTRNRLYA